MLHRVPQVDKPRVYCGPTAISSVTGVHPLHVVETVMRLRGDWSPVVGMTDYEVCNVLGFMGYAARFVFVRAIHPYKVVRLESYFADWVGNHKPCIVSLSNHYVATDGVEVVCNQTAGEPVCMIAHKYAKCHIRGIIHVRKRI